MPSYSFKNNKTGEEFDKVMSIADREQYLKDNPNITQLLSKAHIGYGSGNTQGVKVDDGFREVQQKVAKNHPAHTLKMH